MNIRNIVFTLSVVLTATSQSFAIVTTNKSGLNIEAGEKILVLSDRFYYLGQEKDSERQLHFYTPSTGIDVTTDVSIPTFMGYLEGMWIDPASGKVFIAWEEGGMEIREINIVQIEKNGEARPVKVISGFLPRGANGYTTDGQCDIKIKDDYIVITENNKPSVYTLGMKKGSLPIPSKMKIEDPGIGFVKITGDGVNVRKYPDAKSPRLVRESQEFYAGIRSWDDEKEKGVSYEPCHPLKGALLPYYTSGTYPDDWQSVIIEPDYSNGATQGYVSSRFTCPVEIEPIIPKSACPAIIPKDKRYNYDFKPTEMVERETRYIDKGKYEGLWINVLEPGMDEDGAIYFGKKVGDVIVFYAESEYPDYDDKVSGILKTENDLIYGKDKSGNIYGDEYGQQFDIFKLDEKDIETIYSSATPFECGRYLVKVGGEKRIIELPR